MTHETLAPKEILVIALARVSHLSTNDTWGWIILCCGAVLCIVGCLAPALASTHQMSVATPNLTQVVTIKDVSRYCHMYGYQGGGQNSPQLRPTV